MNIDFAQSSVGTSLYFNMGPSPVAMNINKLKQIYKIHIIYKNESKCIRNYERTVNHIPNIA